MHTRYHVQTNWSLQTLRLPRGCLTHFFHVFSVRAPRLPSFSATLWNIQSFNLHKIIWIMFQNEILVQVSADGTLLPVNENKNNHEIDSSLWLEIYSFSVHDSFTRNASGISGPQTPSERCFKNLPLKHANERITKHLYLFAARGEHLPWGKLSFTNYPFALKSNEVKWQFFLFFNSRAGCFPHNS